MKLVERLFVVRHVGVLLPGFRNHHHHGRGQAATIEQQELEDVVESHGVGTIGLNHREQLFQIGPERALRDIPFA